MKKATFTHNVFRVVAFSLVGALMGAILGVGQIYAEVLSNQLVNCQGNVPNPGTTGYTSGGSIYGTGIATSSVSLYDIIAHVRIWHLNGLVQEDRREWSNTTGGSTQTISSGSYGDHPATESYFRTQWCAGSAYFTSWPDYSSSCYAYWSSGNDC